MEKRRFSRLPKCWPLEYSCRLPGSGEICSGNGLSQNISLGGLFLKCENPQPVPGQLIDLTITDIIHQPIGYIKRKFHMSGKVVRVEPTQGTSAHVGVAVQFLVPMDLTGLLGQSCFGNARQVSKTFH